MAQLLRNVLVLGIDETMRSKVQTILTSVAPEATASLEKTINKALDILYSSKTIHAIIIECNVFSFGDISVFIQKTKTMWRYKNTFIVLLSEKIDQQMLNAAVEYDISYLLTTSTLGQRLKKVFQEIDTELTRPSSFRAELSAIDEAASKNDMKKLAGAVHTFFQKFPDSARAKIEYANLCILEGKYELAEDMARKAIKIEPNNLRAKNILARSQLFRGNYGKAIAILEQCDLINPKNIERLLMMGEALLGMNDREGAKRKFSAVAKLDEGNKKAKLGMCITEMDDELIGSAIYLLRDTSSPDEIASFFNNAGIISARRHNTKEACDLYDIAINILTSDDLQAKVNFNKGLANEKVKEFDKAKTAYKKALDLDQNFKRARVHLLALEQGASVLNANLETSDSPEFLDDKRKAAVAKQAGNKATPKPSDKEIVETPTSVKLIEKFPFDFFEGFNKQKK